MSQINRDAIKHQKQAHWAYDTSWKSIACVRLESGLNFVPFHSLAGVFLARDSYFNEFHSLAFVFLLVTRISKNFVSFMHDLTVYDGFRHFLKRNLRIL